MRLKDYRQYNEGTRSMWGDRAVKKAIKGIRTGMKRQGVSVAFMAAFMGWTRPHLERVLAGKTPMTVRDRGVMMRFLRDPIYEVAVEDASTWWRLSGEGCVVMKTPCRSAAITRAIREARKPWYPNSVVVIRVWKHARDCYYYLNPGSGKLSYRWKAW